MSQKPKDAEQELEKQYTAYRSQYETWKEANRGSIGTQAYNEYVTQFENWERDVEKRRKNIRERAEREEREARMKQLEEEERQRKTQAQKEAEDAEAYLQSQQSYLAHHQAAIEAERANKTQMQTVQYHVATQNYGVVHADGAYGSTAVVAATISAPSGGVAPAGPANAPVLWGSNKINYDTKDPMWQKWGIRAAPTHIPMLMRGPTVPTAGWMVNQAMLDKKKIVAPQLTQPKVPVPPPSLFALPPMQPIKGMLH